MEPRVGESPSLFCVLRPSNRDNSPGTPFFLAAHRATSTERLHYPG